MSILPASLLSALRGAVVSAGFTRAITYQVWTSGTLGSAIAATAVIESDISEQRFNESGQRFSARSIVVQHLADVATAARLGDVVNFDSVAFTIVGLSKTDDLPRWRCEKVTSLGAQREDRMRAEGR